jgi:DNA-binding phage protein
MALTREFKDTVAARVQRDPRFREALFTEAMNAYLGGETSAGKAILRDLVNAIIGFEELASVLKKPSKSLHRMLAPHGNPSTENFFGIVNALQKKARVKLHVTAKASWVVHLVCLVYLVYSVYPVSLVQGTE